MIINSKVVSISNGENQLIGHLTQSGKAETRCYRERGGYCCSVV